MNGIQPLMDFLDAQDQKDIKRITHRLLGRLRELDRDDYEALVLHEFEDWGPEGLDAAEDRINELQRYWESMVEDDGDLPDLRVDLIRDDKLLERYENERNS